MTKYARPKTVDTSLTLSFRMQHWACRCWYSQQWFLISHKWMPATNQNINYPRCKAKNYWPSVDGHSHNGAVTVLLSLLRINAANTLVMYNSDHITVQIPHLQDNKLWTLHWRSVIGFSIGYLVPSIGAFITIWTYWLTFWQIETQPCGKAEYTNILARFTLTRLEFIHLADRFIAPAVHLFVNWYSQATAHHSPIQYL